jgi:hypothetical protein
MNGIIEYYHWWELLFNFVVHRRRTFAQHGPYREEKHREDNLLSSREWHDDSKGMDDELHFVA